MNIEKVIKQLLLEKYGMNVENKNSCFVTKQNCVANQPDAFEIEEGNVVFLKDFWLIYNKDVYDESGCYKFVLKFGLLDITSFDRVETSEFCLTFTAEINDNTICLTSETDSNQSIDCVLKLIPENSEVALKIKDLCGCKRSYREAKYEYITKDTEIEMNFPVVDIMLPIIFITAGIMLNSTLLFLAITALCIAIRLFLVFKFPKNKNENNKAEIKLDYKETIKGKEQISEMNSLIHSIAGLLKANN